MTITDLSGLDQFLAQPLPAGYAADRRLLYSPVDQVHAALLYILGSATVSIDLAMYGFDDPDLVNVLKTKIAAGISVRLTLDSSQAGGVHERELLEQAALPNADVSVGTSEKGAIMHLKTAVIDGSVVIHGSTNWSGGGEDDQDNELLVVLDPVEAAIVTARIDAVHAYQVAHPKGI